MAIVLRAGRVSEWTHTFYKGCVHLCAQSVEGCRGAAEWLVFTLGAAAWRWGLEGVMQRAGLLFVMSWAAMVAGAQARPAITPAPVSATGSAAADAGTASAFSATATANPQSVVSPESYVIGPGDQLQVNVWNDPKLSNGALPVRPDGRISLPLLGDVPAAGMTPMQLGQDITGRLQKFVTDPRVTVTMLNVAPKEIFLMGEVARTGPVILTPGMTILQAIATAGGLSPYSKKKLYVLRKSEKGEQKLEFNYKKALSNGDMQGITLMPGDTIVSR